MKMTSPTLLRNGFIIIFNRLGISILMVYGSVGSPCSNSPERGFFFLINYHRTPAQRLGASFGWVTSTRGDRWILGWLGRLCFLNFWTRGNSTRCDDDDDDAKVWGDLRKGFLSSREGTTVCLLNLSFGNAQTDTGNCWMTHRNSVLMEELIRWIVGSIE